MNADTTYKNPFAFCLLTWGSPSSFIPGHVVRALNASNPTVIASSAMALRASDQ